MTSFALNEWQTTRYARFLELRDAHGKVGGTGPGRRYRTEQINYALVSRVAFELQGFARDLHDEAVDYFVATVSAQAGNTALMIPLRTTLTQNRSLDRGNANPGNLGSDYQRLGMSLWQDLAACFPGRASRWNEVCELLNTARNGIAHQDAGKIQQVNSAGFPVHLLRTADRFYSSTSQLCAGLDQVTALHLQSLLGGTRPW